MTYRILIYQESILEGKGKMIMYFSISPLAGDNTISNFKKACSIANTDVNFKNKKALILHYSLLPLVKKPWWWEAQ